MKINYVTIPIEKYVTRNKPEGAKHSRTSYTCPLCGETVAERKFEEHVKTDHPANVDKAFALLFGLEYPVRCSCGKMLHYSPANHGFPTSCSMCAESSHGTMVYTSAEDALNHIKKMEEDIAYARQEVKRLEMEAELSCTPLKDFPFPTRKDTRFLKRLAIELRTHTVNGDKEKLFELANFISSIADK